MEKLCSATSSASVDPNRHVPVHLTLKSNTTTPQHTFLGETTRSQFKIESFEGIVNTTLTVRDDLAEKTTRGVVDFEEVNKLISILQCPQCNHATLSLSTDNKRHKGLAVHATVYCNSCDQSISEGYLAAKRKGTQLYDINRQAVFSSLIAGLGSTTFNNFCESMNLTGIHNKTYYAHANHFYSKIPDLESHVFEQTAAYMRQTHAAFYGTPLGTHLAKSLCYFLS